jgi:DNA/RNA endonuclease YhcR with UshA esterase domain
LKYYWSSKSLTLYQKDGIIRLCNETQTLSPSWAASSENQIQLEKAEVIVKRGLPITISGRGGISKSTSEVYIDRINNIESGVNLKCEKAK